ncbi:chemotaxis protein CheX [Paenibacillus sp. sgz302251]|uniref:chemotaxis protein CheX n=1 Tax=Paenibacillus sp. sgz302251 TaxID=3414493 RepID=UPI003C7BF9D5
MSIVNVGVNDLVESIIASARAVLHVPLNIEEPRLYNETVLLSEMCVLVGFTGDLEGRLVIDGGIPTFGKLGESMFGMALEGEMLHSFVGEIANMVAGNVCTHISQKGLKFDITPPTILEGEIKMYGYNKAIAVPLVIHNIGEMNFILLLQKEKGE